MVVMAKKQRRPKWVTRRLTLSWQRRAIAKLKELGWTRKRFAQELGCTPGAVTGLLNPKQPSSRLVEPACELLQIPEPEYDDELDDQMSKALRRLKAHARPAYDNIMAETMKQAAKLGPDQL